MGKEITNDFSWSKSRHMKFAECRRAYYFHYYGSWGGWEQRADPKKRELWLLKRLSNRWTWAGSAVHQAIKDVLLRLKGGVGTDAQRLLDMLHASMRRDFVQSRERAYWESRIRPEFNGLVEHEYREDVTPAEWKANWDNVQQALTWFFDSRWPPLARSLAPGDWLEVDEMDFEASIFFIDGVKVFAVPDLAYLGEGKAGRIVDWKTGQPRDGYDDQVLGYALYLHHRYGLALDGMQASLVYLNAGTEQTVEIDAASTERFVANFRHSAGQMQALLVDRKTNTPKEIAAFECTDDLTACARCVFRRPCGREQAVRDAALTTQPPPDADTA